MTTFGHRERALMALDHQETDRVPIDMASTHVVAYQRLVQHLGLEKEAGPVETHATRSHMAAPSEAVLQRLGVDFRHIGLGQPERRPNQVIDKNSHRDEWGVVWARAGEGQPLLAQRGPMEDKEPSLADLERFPWPDPRDPGRVKGLRARALKLRQETDCAIVLGLPYCVLRECQRLRGFAESMADLLVNPTLAQAMMERVTEVSAGIATAALEEVGDIVDVVMFPEDMGTQNQCFMRPELYRKMLKPYHRRFVGAIRSKTHAVVLMHSDGAVRDIIRDFMDIGVQSLNPIQVSAAGMGDTRRLKAEFGSGLSFWGAIDTGRVLPFGTPSDVEAEVKLRIDHLAPSGGYVLAAVHTIMEETPPENVAAMLNTAYRYRPGGR